MNEIAIKKIAIQKVWGLKAPVRILYLHLLLNAKTEAEDGLRRGQLSMSRIKLATDSGLSEMQVRYGLKVLNEYNLVTVYTANKRTTITVCSYKHYVLIA